MPLKKGVPIFRHTADVSAVARFQVVGPQGSKSRPDICEAKGVRRIVSDGAIEQVEKLVSELRAISHWDAEYKRHRCPEWYETVAYASRQKRRSEIIRQLYKIRTKLVV